jgi:hypothetical protein
VASPNAGHAAWCARMRAAAEARSGSLEEDRRRKQAAGSLARYHANADRLRSLQTAKARERRKVRGGAVHLRKTLPRNAREAIVARSRWGVDIYSAQARRAHDLGSAWARHDAWLASLDEVSDGEFGELA